ncbi:membrane protein insertase YidC [Streptococcus sp. H49]|uniref:membrane protein insertase YidC n=1 Tax=Streptococcus huangxiaojuni TaxID=3237239 RepID=UPI0034A0DB46
MKKNLKRILLSGTGAAMLLLLSGCVGRDANGNPSGIIWDFLGRPMTTAIDYFANNMGLGYGLGIILVTIIVRTVILPLNLQQSKKASYQSEKTAYLKPIFEPINERIKNAKNQEEKLAAQSELMAAQRENGVSVLGGIGCLPLLIQMPFISALYFAAREVPNSNFLGINLAERSLVLTAIIAVLYLLQSWLSLQSVAEEQKAQMRTTMYMMPLMMVMMSISLPASVALYWFVGGIFSIAQQLITTYLIRPKLREQVEKEFKENPPKAVKSTNRPKDVTPASAGKPQTAIAGNRNKRNAGKQKRRH